MMSTEEEKLVVDPPKEEEEKEDDDDEDLEKLQAEIARMEAEAAKISKETEDLENKKSVSSITKTGDPALSTAAAKEAAAKRDGFSVYVGQVDYGTTPEELLAHFEACGQVERITIVCDKKTGNPKGYAYIEFQADDAVENAVKLDGSTFKDRQLKVTHKRVNDPNHFFNDDSGGGRGGGRGFRGRGGGFRGGRGGGFRGGRDGGFRGRGGGRRGGFRGGGRGGGGGGYPGGGRGGYHPYY